MSQQLGERIKEFRVSEGLTQQQLADILGVSRQAVSNWEIARTEPDVGMLNRMSRALHRGMECFFAEVKGDEALRYSCMNFIDGLIGESKAAHGISPEAGAPQPGRYEGGFLYNGGSVRLIPDQMEKSEKGYALRLPQGLTAALEHESVDGGAYWLPRLRNDGAQDSGQIAELRSLDIFLPESCVFYSTLRGDNADETSFMPVKQTLGAGDVLRVSPNGGRSSEHTGFPFFTLSYGSEAALVAIGWSGQWHYEIAVSKEGTRVTVGLPEADFYLHAGEEVRLPSVLLLREPSEEAVLQRLRSFIRSKTAAFQPVDRPLPICLQTFDRYVWGATAKPDSAFATEEGQKRLVDAMNRCGGFEVLWVDACWFKDADTFPGGVGNYSCAPGFPNGLAPVADYAHESGYRLMVWFEPERVYTGSEVWREHPDYLIRLDDDNTFLLDLSRPEVVEYIAELLLRTMRENKIDIYRQDANIWPLAFWNRKDEPGRRGVTEMHHIDGLYRLWDRLREEIPELMIDNCASGGRRIDLETAMRSVVMWRSDMGCGSEKISGRHTSIWQQNITLALSRYLPFQCSGTWEADAYDFRCCGTSGIACDLDVLNPDFDFEQARQAIEEFRQLRKYWSGEFYPMTEPTTDESVWCVFRLALEDSGAVYCFRRPESKNPDMLLSVPDAKPGAYRLVLRAEDRSCEERKVTGEELRRGIRVALPQPRTSLVMEYVRI